MSDPAFEIQKAVFAALAAAPAVAGGRIYDRVPRSPTFPYVTIGDGDTVGDDTDCYDSSEVTVTVHVWSREPDNGSGLQPGFPESKIIAGLVRSRLKQEFVLTGFSVVNAQHLVTRNFRDPDGVTSHAVIEMRYLVDHETP